MRTCIISSMSSNFGQIWPPTTELAALEHRKKIPWTCNGKKEVITFSRLFLIGSFSYLQVMRTYIKAYMSLNFGQIPTLTTELARTCIILWMSSNFGQIGPRTMELAALERLRNTPIDLIMGKMVFPLFLCCFWLDPFDTFIFWNEIWPWHIGLRWAIVAFWATCYYMLGANLGLLLYGDVSVMRRVF